MSTIICEFTVVNISSASSSALSSLRGVNRGMQIRPSVFALNPKSGQKNILLHIKSKIRAQKIDESAIHCNCRIRKSVKILFESEIRAKIFSKSSEPFAYSPASSLWGNNMKANNPCFLCCSRWQTCIGTYFVACQLYSPCGKTKCDCHIALPKNIDEHSMTGPEGNSKFCWICLGKYWDSRETKLTVSWGISDLFYSWKFWSWKFIKPHCNDSCRSTFRHHRFCNVACSDILVGNRFIVRCHVTFK